MAESLREENCLMQPTPPTPPRRPRSPSLMMETLREENCLTPSLPAPPWGSPSWMVENPREENCLTPPTPPLPPRSPSWMVKTLQEEPPRPRSPSRMVETLPEEPRQPRSPSRMVETLPEEPRQPRYPLRMVENLSLREANMIMAPPLKIDCMKEPYIRLLGVESRITTEHTSPELKRAKTEGPEIQKIQTKWRMAQVDQSELEEKGGELDVYHFRHRIRFEFLDPDKEFYLLPPYSTYYYCHLDLYQRLVVNNMSTRRNKFSKTWSRDLVRDDQYVQFYEILRLQILDKVPSWKELMASRNVYGFLEGSDWYPEPSNMKEYEVIAFKVAKESRATSLTHDDINECMKDIIQEKFLIKPRLELSKEFHLHLLDSGYDMTELPFKHLSWRKNEKIPIIRHLEISAYEKWFSQRHIRSMDKGTKRKELEKLHNEKAEQDTSNRIRYLTLKLELVEKLGIISQILDG